jgi:hypothetical protein
VSADRRPSATDRVAVTLQAPDGERGILIGPADRVAAVVRPDALVDRTLGEELDEISHDLDAAGAAWVAAGYGYDTPECEAREAVFARLKAWNAKVAGRTTAGVAAVESR